MATKIILDDAKLQRIKAMIADQKPDRWIIRDGVEYGIYVELGTSRMSARPSLIPAVEVITKELEPVIGAAIEAGQNINDALAKIAFDLQALWVHNITHSHPKPPIETGAFRDSIIARKR